MSLIKSFGYAFSGLAVLLSERNFRIHLVAAALVLAAGMWFDITTMEWIAVLICIAMVLMAEGFNTAIELICDRITTDQDSAIKKIKDVSAGAVLIGAFISAVVAAIIFLPKII